MRKDFKQNLLNFSGKNIFEFLRKKICRFFSRLMTILVVEKGFEASSEKKVDQKIQ